jgi:hypothetical protein
MTGPGSNGLDGPGTRELGRHSDVECTAIDTLTSAKATGCARINCSSWWLVAVSHHTCRHKQHYGGSYPAHPSLLGGTHPSDQAGDSQGTSQAAYDGALSATQCRVIQQLAACPPNTVSKGETDLTQP